MLEKGRDENTLSRSNEENMTTPRRSTRSLPSYIPVTSAGLGIVVVVSSVVFFYVEDDLRRLVAVTFGLGFLLASIWFAAHPFFKNTRRYTPFRGEVDGLIDLTRTLHRQVVTSVAPEDVERTKARMHEVVDSLAAAADKTS